MIPLTPRSLPSNISSLTFLFLFLSILPFVSVKSVPRFSSSSSSFSVPLPDITFPVDHIWFFSPCFLTEKSD